MTNSKIFIIGIILSFISGVVIVSINPLDNSHSVFASIQNLYQASQPPLPKAGDVAITGCDWFGNNCQQSPITDDQRETIFENWCYSVDNYYHVGKSTQVFRTMSHDCLSYIIDQKLQPLNTKLDNLTAEIHSLKARLK